MLAIGYVEIFLKTQKVVYLFGSIKRFNSIRKKCLDFGLDEYNVRV